MSLSEYKDFIYGAMLLDWSKERTTMEKVKEALDVGDHVHLEGFETDLHMSVKGRNAVVGDATNNLPGGETFTAPLDDSAEGTIYFDFPGVLGGRLMHDIRLTWEHGRLVDATASTNQDFLQSVVNTDPGASLIGEFAIGTNPEVKLFCKDILLDEKIDGTIHIALGRAYPSVGGTNQSAIHWDIIKDMRQEGEIHLDGELIYRQGKFLI